MGSISVDNMYENLCNILKAQGRVEKISKSFSEMTNDNDRVKVVYNLLSDMQLLPSFQTLKIRSKNSIESTRLRNEGNKSFQKKDDNEALKLYTQSIMCAPVPNLNESCNTDNMSLGFANRSAVLFAKGKFKDCLRDIDLAFEYEYPTKLRYKLLERKAKCCHNLNRLTEAEKYLMETMKFLSLAEGMSEGKRQQIEKELNSFQNVPQKVNLPITESTDLSQELPEKTHDQHLQIPCASSAMKICYSSDMGRFVEAAENIKPGDVLLVEEPYASVLLPEFYSSHCSLCLRHSWSPVPCLHCTMVVYCSAQCRARAWEVGHQVECNVLPVLEQLDAGKFSLLSLRIVLVASRCGTRLPAFLQQLDVLAHEELSVDKALLGFDANGMYRSDAYGPIYHLVGNTETRAAGDLFRRAVTAACVLDCLQRMSGFFQAHGDDNGTASTVVGGVLLRHLQNLPCNAHEVTEYIRTQSAEGHQVAESIEIGAAAYATLSLLNHGCDPSVVRHSATGACVVLRALRPLQCGDQLLDNYGQHYALHPRAMRQAHLQSQYHFSCSCQPCMQNWPCYSNLPSTSPCYLCLKCHSQLPCKENTTSAICPSCGEKTDILELQQKLLTSSKCFLQLLTKLLEGNELTDETPLVEHLQLLDSRVQRPWKEYSDCQETLKQCFNLRSNYYCR